MSILQQKIRIIDSNFLLGDLLLLHTCDAAAAAAAAAAAISRSSGRGGALSPTAVLLTASPVNG